LFAQRRRTRCRPSSAWSARPGRGVRRRSPQRSVWGRSFHVKQHVGACGMRRGDETAGATRPETARGGARSGPTGAAPPAARPRPRRGARSATRRQRTRCMTIRERKTAIIAAPRARRMRRFSPRSMASTPRTSPVRMSMTTAMSPWRACSGTVRSERSACRSRRPRRRFRPRARVSFRSLRQRLACATAARDNGGVRHIVLRKHPDAAAQHGGPSQPVALVGIERQPGAHDLGTGQRQCAESSPSWPGRWHRWRSPPPARSRSPAKAT